MHDLEILYFVYCTSWNFRGGFIFANFASQTLAKISTSIMSIYSNDNISKIAKLTTRELPHLAKTVKIMAYTVYQTKK